MSGEIMTIQQAADYLQVCDKTVRRLIERKELTVGNLGVLKRVI